MLHFSSYTCCNIGILVEVGRLPVARGIRDAVLAQSINNAGVGSDKAGTHSTNCACHGHKYGELPQAHIEEAQDICGGCIQRCEQPGAIARSLSFEKFGICSKQNCVAAQVPVHQALARSGHMCLWSLLIKVPHLAFQKSAPLL